MDEELMTVRNFIDRLVIAQQNFPYFKSKKRSRISSHRDKNIDDDPDLDEEVVSEFCEIINSKYDLIAAAERK